MLTRPGMSTHIRPTITVQNDTEVFQSRPQPLHQVIYWALRASGIRSCRVPLPLLKLRLVRIFSLMQPQTAHEGYASLNRNPGRGGTSGSVVIIHLGSNCSFEAPIFDQVMKSLLTHQVKRIIFIDVHRPIGWEYYVNNHYAGCIIRWPQAELIDWDAIAYTRQEWFIEDQTYLSYATSKADITEIQEKLEAAILSLWGWRCRVSSSFLLAYND